MPGHFHFQETRVDTEELERLLAGFEEISQAMLASVDMGRVLDTLALQVVDAGVFRSLMVALVDDESQTLTVVRSAYRGSMDVSAKARLIDAEQIGHTFHLSDRKDLASEAARTKSLVVIEGWDDRFAPLNPEKFRDNVAYFIPVMHSGRVLAVLATGSAMAQKSMMLHRIEMMQPFLKLVAVALTHARLFEDLRASQEKLREVEKLQVLIETAGAAAHEISQPLQGIIGLAEVLKEDLSETERHKLIGNILGASMRIKEILDKMQDIRQYATKKYVGEHNIVDWDQAVKSDGDD